MMKNIVKIFEVGEEGSIHYIATEFIEGMTVKDYIMTCSPLPIEEVMEQIFCNLLSYQGEVSGL